MSPAAIPGSTFIAAVNVPPVVESMPLAPATAKVAPPTSERMTQIIPIEQLPPEKVQFCAVVVPSPTLV